MNTCCDNRSSLSAGQFSLGLFNVLITRCMLESIGSPVRLRRPHMRAVRAGFGLTCLASAFMNNPG